MRAIPAYRRAASATDWWMLAQPRELGMVGQLCVEGDGTIDPAALAAAVAAASQACPGARLVRGGRQWVDSGQAPAVRVVDADDFDRTRLDSPLLRTPLAGPRAASCEVVLVRGAPTTVIFRAHHAVMDGRGILLWQTEVFRALRGDAIEAATSPLTCDEIRAEIAARLGREVPPVDPPYVGSQWRSLLGKVPSGPRGSMWRRRTIDGVHPGVTAKIAQLTMAYGGGQGLIGIPVDLRHYLPGLRTTALASTTVYIPVRADEDWTEVQQSLFTALGEHAYLGDRTDPRLLKTPLPVLRAFTRWGDNQVRKNDDAVGERGFCRAIATVSHLGTVDLADFCVSGFFATAFYSLGTVYFAPEISIAETKGRTEVIVSWRDGPGAADRAEDLLDWIEEGLSPRGHRDWAGNRTDREAPPSTLTRMFAEQVRRSPDTLAVASADGDLTYAELNEQAGAVAAALQARGIGRGDPVGLVASRSPAMIVGVWGILKAGAAYLPIDESFPDTRITQILTDARVPVCLMESPNESRDFLPAGCDGVRLSSMPRTAPAGWRDVNVDPGDLANVIYTSGSTGVPKGVEIEHRGMVNFVRWVTREAGVDSSAKMPLIASISFDITDFGLFLPLLAGGTVLPIRDVNAATMREMLEDSGANVMAITPSHLDLISKAGIRRSTMRLVIAGGEVLRRSTALRAKEMFGAECTILNHWAPTEATVVSTSHEFDPERDTDATIPLGRPMDNNKVHLIDSDGRFVSPGEPGEAYIGGVQVARGYVGRPDLTRQRFVRLADGSRVYRTGDILRLLPTGVLSFISRADDQVKIAGHRIEPAEIAQVLETHPRVRQATVHPRSRPGRQDKELCGYVVMDGAGDVDLKEFLAGRLPKYMVPAAIVTVAEIPRNASGKTDASQLPDPFASSSDSYAPAPASAFGQDSVTDAVCRIWAQTLQVDPGLLDEQTNFHRLGGSSMMLLTMIDEVSRSVVEDGREEFMAELAKIIREPTLGQVCELVRQTRVPSSRVPS